MKAGLKFYRAPRLVCGRWRCIVVLLLSCWLSAAASEGQMLTPGDGAPVANPLGDTAMKPGKALLMELDARFARATLAGGGKAFVGWLAEDAVSLANGKAAVEGREAIAKQATWTPEQYQLTWTPTDAVLSQAGDMGYSWGHYEGRGRDAAGNPIMTSGRYVNLWRLEPDGSWKVILNSSNEEPVGAGDCCRLPPV